MCLGGSHPHRPQHVTVAPPIESVDNFDTQVGNFLPSIIVKSPTAPGDGHLRDKGFAQFLRKALSIDLAAIKHEMVANIDDLPFCRPLGNDVYIGDLPLDETFYYNHYAAHCLAGTQECSKQPGNKAHASTLYPNAFGDRRCSVNLSSGCAPEFAMRVKDIARISENGEVKPIPAIALEELYHYTAISMAESYFSQEQYPEHRAYYKSPPLGAGVLGMGPMGMMFIAEWVGVIFFSIISEPFYAGSNKQAAAKAMIDDIESTREYSDPLLLPLTLPVKTSVEKRGVAWGVFKDTFIKVIEAPFLSTPLPSKCAFNKSLTNYRESIGEEACADGAWQRNSSFFYHLFKVMAAWKRVWAEEAVGDDAIHRAVFVPVTILYGEFSICLSSPCVGVKDSTDDSFENDDVMGSVVEAVLWLARRWQLLYIDLRPPNLRIDDCDGANKLYLIDYDDILIMKEKPCCDHSTVRVMRKNPHIKKVFGKYKSLAKLFERTVSERMCHVCSAV
eukprot:CAMPEP_0184988908 /NCGR_PEP_ID=MMETSP1098-20130426/26334_1 /TAXON_ID=89044 /ORGANISM="Spumella elongata, Strain CCAP 955/1" /LENGTH=502 /DNA_ID=CAMNT_0027513769 /DNA_START=120 /DNA_END=1628 /DNA_ORIENTATION=+